MSPVSPVLLKKTVSIGLKNKLRVVTSFPHREFPLRKNWLFPLQNFYIIDG